MSEATQTYLQIDALEPNITPPDFNEAVENQLKNLKDTADRQSRDLSSHKKLLDWTFGFIVAILVVCVMAFVTFLLDAWRFQANEYAKFTGTLNQQQNQKIGVMESLHSLELRIQKIELENQKSRAMQNAKH